MDNQLDKLKKWPFPEKIVLGIMAKLEKGGIESLSKKEAFYISCFSMARPLKKVRAIITAGLIPLVLIWILLTLQVLNI